MSAVVIDSQENRVGREPKRGVCADCFWCSGALKDRCDQPQVISFTADGVHRIIRGRSGKSPCGPSAALWEPR